MPRTSKTEQELGYLRSAWEEVEYAGVETHFKVTVELIPTISRGVWCVSIVGTSHMVDETGAPLITEKAQFRFPNGRMVTFAGELWAVLHKFNVQLEESYDAWMRWHAPRASADAQ